MYREVESRRKYYREKRMRYMNYLFFYKKKIGKCQRCGWNQHIEILEFHHRDKETKRFSISAGHAQNFSWSIIIKELKKCDVLCSNCHRWLEYNQRDFFIKVGSKWKENK